MSRQFSSPRLKTHWSRAFLVSGHEQQGLRGLPSAPIGPVGAEVGAEGVGEATTVVGAGAIFDVCGL